SCRYVFLNCPRDHPYLHSFPTRRSSDLVEIGLKVLRANAVVATSEPAFQITEDQMGDRQKVLGHAGITLRRDRQMPIAAIGQRRSEEHTSELQSRSDLVCRLLLEKKKNK